MSVYFLGGGLGQATAQLRLSPPVPGPSRPSPPPKKKPPTPDDSAQSTLKAVADGTYTTPDGKTHSISERIQASRSGTTYYPPEDPALEGWATLSGPSEGAPTNVHFRLQSTLAAARERAWSARAPYERIGVLNCGAPIDPGGGFGEGAKTQEAALARASNLFHSLTSPTATPFYQNHMKSANCGMYTNAMIHSKDVILMKDDLDNWSYPLTVDVLTSTPIDARAVREKLDTRLPVERVDFLIHAGLEERMGRILKLFECSGDNVLILTTFGAGPCQYKTSAVARRWARLLTEGGRFHGVFSDVIFALPTDQEYSEFCKAFNREATRLAAEVDAEAS